MEIHFYESIRVYPHDKDITHDWEMATRQIDYRADEIHTTQMCLLSTTLFHKGYRVFIHQGNGITYELTLQTKDNYGERTVRHSQSMYAMWASNVFRE